MPGGMDERTVKERRRLGAVPVLWFSGQPVLQTDL